MISLTFESSYGATGAACVSVRERVLAKQTEWTLGWVQASTREREESTRCADAKFNQPITVQNGLRCISARSVWFDSMEGDRETERERERKRAAVETAGGYLG